MTNKPIIQLVDQLSVTNILGEGIQWNADRGEAWWTDIIGEKLFSYHLADKQLTTYDVPESVCSFAFVDSGDFQTDGLLVAFASGLAYYNPVSQVVKWIKPNLCDKLTQRLNDGRVDRQGRFWVGSMSLLNKEYGTETGRAQLFCLDQNQNLSIRENNIHISNGTCWSPDSGHMYFADSPRREIYRYDFDPATGTNTRQHILHKTPQGAFPDGACVDSQGYLWSAHWGASMVVRYNPDGSINKEIQIPATQPSCVAFGGENLDLLFVTTARQDLTEEELNSQPQAGDVFIYKTNIVGLTENRYQRSNE